MKKLFELKRDIIGIVEKVQATSLGTIYINEKFLELKRDI